MNTTHVIRVPFFFALFFTLLLLPAVSALEWSEVLPDPDGADDGKEYIELIGTRDLEGCIISDAKSADTLELLQRGDEVILIIETESQLNATPEVTIYGAGKAIGNGLGNTADNLTIACDGELLLQMEYNTSLIEGYATGMALHHVDGAWIPDIPSPGEVNDSHPDHPSDPPSDPPGDPQDDAPGEVPPQADPVIPSGGSRACNDTLAITLSSISGQVGDVISFTLLSSHYASYEASAEGAVFSYGDTLAHAEHAITLPDAAEVRIIAKSDACGSERRAVRIIAVQPREKNISVRAAMPSTLPRNVPPPERDTSDGLEVKETIAATGDAASAPAAREETSGRKASSRITGAVVVDEDGDAVPWIAAFGIVTLLVSAWLFFHTTRATTREDTLRLEPVPDLLDFPSPAVPQHEDATHEILEGEEAQRPS